MTPTDRQFTKEVGRRLAQLRQDAGLTQQAVAAELGSRSSRLSTTKSVACANRTLEAQGDLRALLHSS